MNLQTSNNVNVHRSVTLLN